MTTLKRDSMDATTLPSLKPALPQTQSPAPKPTLATLPLPLLKAILSPLLDAELATPSTAANVSYTPTLLPSGALQFRASRPPFPVHAALFYVNRHISDVARSLFYAQNLFVRLTVKAEDARHARNLVLDSGLLFVSPEGDALARVRGHALDVVIGEKGSDRVRAGVLFPAQYLPRLVNFMEQACEATKSWAKQHSLHVSVRNSYGFSVAGLQGDVLEPFRFLSGFEDVKIEGAELLAGYAEGLRKSMMGASSVEAWLGSVEEMAAQGESAVKRGEGNVGREHFSAAIISLTHAYLTRPELLHSQDEAFATRIQRLRWKCELGTGVSILSQHKLNKPTLSSSPPASFSTPQTARDLLKAETALSSALSLSTNSPSPASNPWLATLPVDLVPPNQESWFTDAERGESWFRLGLAHAALGEFLFAAGDLERAVRLVGETGEVETVFEWVRGRIDWRVAPGDGLKRAGRMARRPA